MTRGYAVMNAGRIELRATAGVLAHIEGIGRPGMVAVGEVDNMSARGARVMNAVRWHPREQVVFRIPSADFRAVADVVYCQPVGEANYAVGLHFQQPEPASQAAA